MMLGRTPFDPAYVLEHTIIPMTELDDNEIIYRIYSLPDLINTLYSNTIRLSQAARMNDRNELFGIYFDLMRSEFGPTTVEQIPKTQREFRKAQTHHYMTCWTQTHDNIAVWSLYSPNKDAIQVSTTYGRLKNSIIKYYEDNSIFLSYNLEPNDPRDLFFIPEIGSVEYVDFVREYEILYSQYEKYFEEKDFFFKEHRVEREKNSIDFEHISEDVTAWRNISKGIRKRIFGKSKDTGALLKDKRYEHEKEVRFVLSLYRRDACTKAEYEADPMAGLDDPARHPPPDECPHNIFVPFVNDGFLSFETDGRIEDWKFEAISHVLSSFGLTVEKNAVFEQIEI